MESEGGGHSSRPGRTGQSVPPSLPPGADCPGLVSTPGRPRGPHPQHSVPCLRDPAGEPGRAPLGPAPPPHTRASSVRAFAPPAARGGAAGGAGQLPTPRSGRVQPSPLPRRGEAPSPARRALPAAPVCPGPGPQGRCSDAACRARRLGVQPATAEHPPSTMAVRASPAQSRRFAHSAASETPTVAPAFLKIEFTDFFPPLYLEAGWAGLPRLCPASHPGCCMGFEQSPSASGSRRARAGRAAGRAARGHSLRLALPSRRLARPPSR